MSDPATEETDGEGDLLETLASLPSFYHPTADPVGDRVAVYYDGTGRNELHVLDPATGDLERWTDGQVPRDARWHLRWDAGGDRVFYHRDDAGDEQNDVHAVDRNGHSETVVEMDGQVVLADVGRDGETLLVGSTRDGQMNLYRHDLPTAETAKITDYERAVWGGLLSPDCERVAYATNESEDYDNLDVYVANADGSDPRNLHVGETGAEAVPVDWSPDGSALLVSDNTEDLERCGVYDIERDEVRWLGDGDVVEEPVAFGPDGERVVALRTRRAAVAAVVYDLGSGESRTLDLPEGVASIPREGSPWLADGRLLLTHTTSDTRPDLLAYDLATDEHEVLLAAEYDGLDPGRFVEAEYLTFESDGVADTEARAVELEPAAEYEIGALLYDSGERPSPLVVNPHGGPRAADQRAFGLYTQFLCSRGYSVLQVNYRGSTGRGREFVEALYDDWGGAEQADVARGVEHVLETREWIDEDRVVVFGGSYGGYSAYWQLLQYPSLYAAGVAWIGVTDLPDMYEHTMPHYRTELMEKYLGTPEENPDLYEERSPIEHVENLAAPLLIVHGVNDHRVPVSQARRFRGTLDDFGYTEGEEADYEYVELGEEGHASSDIEQKTRTLRLLDDFLDRRVGAAGDGSGRQRDE